MCCLPRHETVSAEGRGALRRGQGYAWAEDKEHCEEYGRMLNADPSCVSARAKKRGLPQVRSSGRHISSIPRVPSPLEPHAWGPKGARLSAPRSRRALACSLDAGNWMQARVHDQLPLQGPPCHDGILLSKCQVVWAGVQMGTLGAGNHYAEIQVVDEIFDAAAARKMGIERTGQVCIMIHSGSRGLGHQVQPLGPSVHPLPCSFP